MVLREEVINAFEALGITPDTPEDVAKSTYKKLALTHHPDRNHDDPAATQKFQQISRAWETCLRHYDDECRPRGPYDGPPYSAYDDIPLDPEEEENFFRFMFAEMLFNRFSYARGRSFRAQRSGAGETGVRVFSGGLAELQERQEANNQRQRKRNEAYLERVKELEREIAAEQAEKDKAARELVKQQERVAKAYGEAFSSGRAGNGDAMKSIIEEYELDVNSPRNQRKERQNQKPVTEYETLLHVAAKSCDETVVQFLINKGANTASLDTAKLTPFHTSILSGNIRVVEWFVKQQHRKPMDGCHPSKAARDAARRTTLQLAIASGVPDIVEMLLNDAPVHDVRRCWDALEKEIASALVDDERTRRLLKIQQTLLKKKGFTSDVNQENAPKKAMSKKALQQAAQLQVETEAAAQMAKLRAEEAQRRKEDKLREEAEKRKVEEQRQAAQRQAEEARRASEKEALRREEERHRAATEEARRKAEEARRAAEKEAQRQEEERRRAAAEEARRKEEEARRAAEKEAQRQDAERRKAAEKEARRLANQACRAAEREAKRQEREKRKAAEREVRRAAEKEAQRREKEERKAIAEEARLAAEREIRRLEEEKRKAAEKEAGRIAEEARLAAEREAQRLEEEKRKAAEKEARREAEKEAHRAAKKESRRIKNKHRGARKEMGFSAGEPTQQLEQNKHRTTEDETSYLAAESRPLEYERQQAEARSLAQETQRAAEHHKRMPQEAAAGPKPATRQNNQTRIKPSERKPKIDDPAILDAQTRQRRAEQSARDKEQHRRRRLEEKSATAKASGSETTKQTSGHTLNCTSPLTSLSPISTSSDFLRTPSSDIAMHNRPNVALLDREAFPTWMTDRLDIQTCAIPESLFAFEPAVQHFSTTSVMNTTPQHRNFSAQETRHVPSNPLPVAGEASGISSATSVRNTQGRRGGQRGRYHSHPRGIRHDDSVISQLQTKVAQQDNELKQLRVQLSNAQK